MPEGARDSAVFIAVGSEPDYCWTPIGGQQVLVPYVVACDLSGSQQCSPNVRFTGEAVFLHSNSLAPTVEGNEPGLGDGAGASGVDDRGNGGLLSGIHNGTVWVEEHSKTVNVNGISVVRHEDGCWMNHKP